MTSDTNYKKAIIITAPSGSGKTTITNHILEKLEYLSYSVSATTRKPREGEIDGIDYYYINAADFVKKIKDNEFIEWEEVYTDMYYGTLKTEVERVWNQKKVVVFVVDVIGAKRLKEYFKEKALSIFILPPSLKVLEERLMARGSETHTDIEKRKARFIKEMDYVQEFDEIILNDNLDEACVKAIDMVKNFVEN